LTFSKKPFLSFVKFFNLLFILNFPFSFSFLSEIKRYKSSINFLSIKLLINLIPDSSKTREKPNSLILSKKLSNKNTDVVKAKNFYESHQIGGNTNIWGGYVNLKILKRLKSKNKRFKNFIEKNKFFKIAKLSNNKKFCHVGYFKNLKNNKIFRISDSSFFNKIINFDVFKIEIKKKFILIKSKNKIFKSKKINFCVGNLGLIKILYNSNILKKEDIVSFEDGSVGYNLNFFLNKENYYIPMPLSQILAKLIFNKSSEYSLESYNKNLIVQYFSNKPKTYQFTVNDLIYSKSFKLRYFLSNHITNLKINKLPVNIFLKRKSKRILVNSSGSIKKYIPGSISQNLIYNAFLNN